MTSQERREDLWYRSFISAKDSGDSVTDQFAELIADGALSLFDERFPSSRSSSRSVKWQKAHPKEHAANQKKYRERKKQKLDAPTKLE